MKQNHTLRTAFASLFFLALSVTIANAFPAQGQHLTLKGNGRSYAVTTDGNGIFSFTNVEPGTYQLVWVLPNGTTPDNTSACSIEISSFSWGATQIQTTSSGDLSQGKSTPVTRSNISNNRGGVQVTGDLAQGKSTPVTRSNISNNRTSSQFVHDGNTYCVIVLENVMVSSLTTATGTVTTAKATPKLMEAVVR